MFRNDQFEDLGILEAGKLAIKLPGADFTFVYSGGHAFVDRLGNLGYVALELIDFVGEPRGEPPQGEMRFIVASLLEEFQRPATRAAINRGELVGKEVYLFGSRSLSGRNIVTIPSLDSELQLQIDDKYYEPIVGFYSMVEEQGVKEVCEAHVQVIGNRELDASSKKLEELIKRLPRETQKVYDHALELFGEIQPNEEDQ